MCPNEFLIFQIRFPRAFTTSSSQIHFRARRNKLSNTHFHHKNFACLFVGQDDHHEIQRQNRITEQILTNFFERKFFPNRKPKPAPTIDEILPPESRANPSIRNKHSAHRDSDDDEPETDNFQELESEQVDSFYRDYSEGRWNFLLWFVVRDDGYGGLRCKISCCDKENCA
jgi:hypothetical protein